MLILYPLHIVQQCEFKDVKNENSSKVIQVGNNLFIEQSHIY